MSRQTDDNATGAVDAARLAAWRDRYARELFDGALPLWLTNGRDRERGGLTWHLLRDGRVFDHDKIAMWSNGRMIWLLSHMHNHVPNAPAEWLDYAKAGLDFALAHGFAPDGHMHYSLTADGRPLQPAEDVFTELFHVEGFAEYALATHDDALKQRAWDLFLSVWQRFEQPDQAHQPKLADGSKVRLFGHPLIALNVLRDLRDCQPRDEIEPIVDQCLAWIFDYHVREADQVILEHVAWDGSDLHGYLGRMVRPGHMTEAGIFVIHEAQHRGDDALLKRGVELVRWSDRIAWDEKYGGHFTDMDRAGPDQPVPTRDVYRSQGKEWWSHAEALYALLLTWSITGDGDDLMRYERMADYAFDRFSDPQHGDWYLALYRDGTVLCDAKGVARKSLFHLGRNLFWAWRLLDERCRAAGKGSTS